LAEEANVFWVCWSKRNISAKCGRHALILFKDRNAPYGRQVELKYQIRKESRNHVCQYFVIA